MDIVEGFTGFDWIVVSLVGLLAIVGLLRGFTHEALSLAGLILGIVAVRLFHQPVTLWLEPKVGGEASGAIIAFLLLFFGTVIAAKLIASAAGGFAKRSVLGPMDRLLGLGFGALKGLIVSSVMFLLAQFSTGLFDPDQQLPEWLVDSKTAPLLSLSADAMVGWVHELQDDKAEKQGFGLPPGHPPVDPNYGDPVPQDPAQGGQGYSREDRRALDDLLKEGAESGEQVEI